MVTHFNIGMRIPLINPIYASIYRLDIDETWDADPAGSPSEGYDVRFREPVITHAADSRTRSVTRAEMAPVVLPCQVHMMTFEEMDAASGGNDPITNIRLLFHRYDLAAASLINAITGDCLLKHGDRIDHFERPEGTTVRTFQKPLYVYRVEPRSWGAGPAGYDLEVCYTTYRPAGAS